MKDESNDMPDFATVRGAWTVKNAGDLSTVLLELSPSGIDAAESFYLVLVLFQLTRAP